MRSDYRKKVRDGTTIAAAALILLLLSPELPSAAAQSSNTPTNENPYMEAKLTPSMAIIIVVLIAAMFFMGFFSIYIRHCTSERNGTGGASIRAVVGAMAGRSRRNRGLDAAALEALPTFAYSEVKGLKIGKGALECAVCLNEFDDDETLRLLPRCDHVFHAECVDAWLASHTTCPVCRANLAEEGADPEAGSSAAEDSAAEEPRTEAAAASEIHGDAVVVPVAEDSDPSSDPANLPPRPPGSIGNRPARSWSMKKPRFFSRLPRSHSTGHSLIQPGENCERFTLRLPDGVRKQLVNRSMNRAAGLAMLPREGSSRRGFRFGGEGSSRGRNYRRMDRLDRTERAVKSDRWVVSAVPPFFSRAPSLRSPKVAADGEGSTSGAGPVTPRGLLTAVQAPLQCLGSRADGAESAEAETARLQV